MIDPTRGALGLGDRALDFTLPAADVEGTVALAEYLRRGPVLLTMLRGLYCPFCRRHIGQLRPTCEALRVAGIALLGVVVASPERARRYFGHFPPCFPMAAAPDRAIHLAYGLPEVIRTPEFGQEAERRAAEILRAKTLSGACEPVEATIIKVVPLTYARAGELAYTLSLIAPPRVRIVPYYPTNSLIISGPTANVEEIVGIIRPPVRD